MLLSTATRRRASALLVAAMLTLVVALGAACSPPPNGVLIAKRIAWHQLSMRGWAHQAQCLVDLWQAESGWNVFAYNRASGAYGIPQALPAKRMAAAGRDWINSPSTQISWGLNYIGQRYGGPCNAWRVWQTRHWYDKPSTAPANTVTPATPTQAAPTLSGATAAVRLPDEQQ